MRWRHVPILVLILAVSLPIAAWAVGGARESHPELSQSNVVLMADADATVKSWEPNENFGDESILNISYFVESTVGYEAATLVRFDLSSLPPDAVIDESSLRLYLEYADGASPVSIGAYSVTNSWSESTVTWNTPISTGAYGLTSSVDDSTGSYKSLWIASSLVQAWLDDPSSNHGVLLRGPTDGTVYERWFQSREQAEYVPQLELTYHLPAYSFSGHVYEGEPEDTSRPMNCTDVLG